MAASDFFSRWAKRPASEATQVEPPRSTGAEPADPTPVLEPTVDQDVPPSLARARELTPDDDFRPFVRADVDPQVRNVAMRQLFTDPHFNVMDGLDIYIDDYNTPNPLPAGDISRMAGASFLRLIQSEPPTAQTSVGDAAHGTAPSDASPPLPQPETARDDPDLRLQPNPGPGSPDPEPGPV